jgi:transglutaminase-like putative cysteine protease
MKLRIRYRAEYRYAERVSLSPHVLRIFPRSDLFLQWRDWSFVSPEGADCHYRRDLFDNDIATLYFPELREDFSLDLDLTIETPPRNPFHFLLESRALHLPVQYDELERHLLAAYLQPSTDDLRLPAPLAPDVAVPTVEALVTFNQWMHQEIRYIRREEGDPWAPAVTLAEGAGSCRDFSVLCLEVLRRNGLAARLVSGFLWEGDVAAEDHVADGALHAWVETYLPGPGWIGMDPTNGVLCDHHAIPAAVGLTHAQIAPVSGHYYGKKTIPSTLETSLKVEAVHE